MVQIVDVVQQPIEIELFQHVSSACLCDAAAQRRIVDQRAYMIGDGLHVPECRDAADAIVRHDVANPSDIGAHAGASGGQGPTRAGSTG